MTTQTNEKRYVLDTNIILKINVEEIAERFPLAIPSMVIRELEKMELNPDKYGQTSWEAREKRRRLRKLNKIYFDNKDYMWDINNDLSDSYIDNQILKYCIVTGSPIITFDGLLAEKAIEYGVEFIDIATLQTESEEDYKGYKEVHMLQDEYKDFYTNKLDVNEYKLNVNEYLIILDDITGEEVDALKWDGKCHITVKAKSINSLRMGKFAAKDLYQSCAIDSLNTNQFTLLNGKAGTAKTLASLTYAMQQIEKGKYSKLIIFANSMPTKGAAQLGLYKGSLKEKLMQVSIGHILASKFGDYNEVEALMTTGDLVVLPLSDIRGFDTTGMNAIVIAVEAQNMDIPLMKLAAERISEDSKFIVEGDFQQQLDHHSFEGKNNGMRRLSEIFRGEDYFGQVELKNVYRSKIAAKAQEM